MHTRLFALPLLLLVACSSSGSGTAAPPTTNDASEPDAATSNQQPDAGSAGTGGMAGASGSGGGGAGKGGSAAGAGGGGSLDAGPSSSPDAKPDASAPDTAGAVPFLCSGMRAQDNGQPTAGCKHPGIGIECRALNPGPTAEPCVLDGSHNFLYMCVLAGFYVPNDAFCCGTQYAGPGKTQCQKDVATDQNCRCCYPSTPAAPTCTTDADCCSGKCTGGHCG